MTTATPAPPYPSANPLPPDIKTRGLSYRRVYRWLARLARRDPRSIVGTAKEPWSCPLVTHLRQLNPHTEPHVNAQGYSLYPPHAAGNEVQPEPYYHAELDEWAQYFVANVDDLDSHRHGWDKGTLTQRTPITAIEALRILQAWQKLQRLNRPYQDPRSNAS